MKADTEIAVRPTPAVPQERPAGTLKQRLMDSYLLRRTGRYHIGGVLVNRLGFQVARTVFKHLTWRMHPRRVRPEVKPYVDQMERDGIVVIPDFLPEEAFAAVRGEYLQSLDEAHRGGYKVRAMNGLVWERRSFSAEAAVFPNMRKHLEENPTIYKIASAILRKKIKYTAPVWADFWRNPDPEAPNVDLENVLHADIHFPTIKLWFYLDDVDEAKGAYVYAKKSHKLSLARLRHEYDLSVRQALLRNGKKDRIPPDLLDRGRNRIADTSYEKMGIVESSVCGKANTLVISNNFGFHRRGVFATTDRRAALTMSFRYLNSLHHSIYPAFGATPVSGNLYPPGRMPI